MLASQAKSVHPPSPEVDATRPAQAARSAVPARRGGEVCDTQHDYSTRAGRTVVVGLLTDKGMPASVAARLSGELPAVLTEQLSNQVDWQVHTRCDSLRLDENGLIPMLALADEYKPVHDWDVLVLLTDLPRRAGTQPIVSDYSTSRGVGLVSMPALGAFRVQHRTRNLIVHLIGHLLEENLSLDPEPHRHSPHGCLTGRLGDVVAPTKHMPSDDQGIDMHLALIGLRGRLRLLAGMVLGNRPWRLVPHLSSATAAAAATAAYGLMTNNFWQMADALSLPRLALINIVAIAAMAIWLLTYNHLWERPAERAEREKAFLYNVSTLLTLSLGVACMYAILFVLTLVAAGALIDSGYLQAILRHSVGIADYVKIVWLTSSVGIVAGAIGSGLESEEAIRKATYSKREQERQARNRDRAGQDSASVQPAHSRSR